jgi:hypothetical protein
MTRPLALTDSQLEMVRSAAASLPPASRDSFLRHVASHLGSEPGDQAVQLAIDAALAVNQLPTFLCASK